MNRAVIARRGYRLYSHAVREFPWQRWTLILLLVTRLVIGELGHAMPMAALAPIEQATTELASEPPCADHAATGAAAEADRSTGEHDCCETGECECPCLHAPCAAIDAAIMNPVSTTLLRVLHGADTVSSQRPSGLFRPPA